MLSVYITQIEVAFICKKFANSRWGIYTKKWALKISHKGKYSFFLDNSRFGFYICAVSQPKGKCLWKSTIHLFWVTLYNINIQYTLFIEFYIHSHTFIIVWSNRFEIKTISNTQFKKYNIQLQYKRNWVFATNSDFLVLVLFKPNVVDLRYFKLWIILA